MTPLFADEQKLSLLAGMSQMADFVVKVENRTILKISRKLIFRPFCCCVAFRRHYGGPWSILDQPIRSLKSTRAKRISGSKNFRSTPKKTFATKSAPLRHANPF